MCLMPHTRTRSKAIKTMQENSFRYHGPRLLNCLRDTLIVFLKSFETIYECTETEQFKRELDKFLSKTVGDNGKML